MKTNETHRTGRRMRAACRMLAARGDTVPSMLDIAEPLGTENHPSRRYGYATIARCLAAGLMTLDPEHSMCSTHGRGALCLTAAGRDLIAVSA